MADATNSDSKPQQNTLNLYSYAKDEKPQLDVHDLYSYIKDEKSQPNIFNLYSYVKDANPNQPNILDLYSYVKDAKSRQNILELYSYAKDRKSQSNIFDLYSYVKDENLDQPNNVDLYSYVKDGKSQPNSFDLYSYVKDKKLDQPNNMDLYSYAKADAKSQPNILDLYSYAKHSKPHPNILGLYSYAKDDANPQPNLLDLYSYSKNTKPQPSIHDLYSYVKDAKADQPKSKLNFLDLYSYAKDTKAQRLLDLYSYKHDAKEKESSTKDSSIRMVTKVEDDSQERKPMNIDNPIEMIFFTIKDLKVGKKVPFYFPQKDLSNSPPPSLPKEKADSIPFSLKQFPQILNLFSIPFDSPQAQVVEISLRLCELKPMKGEFKICSTSQETMLDSALSILGLKKKSDLKTLKTFHLTNPHAKFQNYTITQMPKEIPVPKFFACHSVPYPYAVYLCHSPAGGTKVLRLPLEGENGDRVDALAVCHMDTSDWTPRHPSFQVLKTKPGTPVCHVFPDTDLLWMS